MRKAAANKLHDRDEVKVRIGTDWIPGYVCGDPKITDEGTFVSVLTGSEGYLHRVHHTDIR